MTRWIQWWRRMVRSGYAAAESLHRRGAETPRIDRRSVRGVVLWVFVLPALAVLAIAVAALRASVPVALELAALAVAVACAQIARTAVGCPSKDASARDAFVYAVSCLAAKPAQSVGMLRYFRDRVRRRTPHLIEYK